jgi:NAD(P)-dependent dehydrogenase (short-subunit alcohol dehydrogenase family)
MTDLRERTVVVTGAARGLGAGLARALTARGARVALLGLEPDELAKVAADCGESAWWEVDVTDAAALARTAAAVKDHFGSIDALVVNAGIAAGGSLSIADAASYERVIEINLTGSIRTVRAFLPALLESRGYILQIASLAAIVPAPFMSAYCASKSGVEAFAHAIRGELTPHGVDVGVAYLTWIDTDMVRGADAIGGMKQMRSSLPYPFNKTYPVEHAVRLLADGVAGRSAHVYAPKWLAVMPLIRGVLPALAALAPKSRITAAEDAMTEGGVSATHAVGAGGAAAEAAAKAK